MKYDELNPTDNQGIEPAIGKVLSRRTFLAGAGALGLSLTVGRAAMATTPTVTEQNPEIAALAAQSIGYKPAISGIVPTVSTNTQPQIAGFAAQPAYSGSTVNPGFRFTQMLPTPVTSVASLTSFATAGNISDPTTPAIVVVDFIVDGSQVELIEYANAGVSQITIDGAPLPSGLFTGPSGNGTYYRLLDFGGVRAQRAIRVQYCGTYFGGINIGPNDTLYYPNKPLGTFGIFLGDDLTVGFSALSTFTGFPSSLGALLGWNVWPDGSADSGYVAGLSKNLTYAARAATDVIPFNPDILVIQGGNNDRKVPAAQLTPAITSLYSYLQSSLPDTEIIVIGPFSPVDAKDTDTEVIAVRGQIEKAATAAGLTFIDLIGFITGAGTTTAPTSTGNASYYIAENGVYPNQAGHDYLARRIAAELVATYTF